MIWIIMYMVSGGLLWLCIHQLDINWVSSSNTILIYFIGLNSLIFLVCSLTLNSCTYELTTLNSQSECSVSTGISYIKGISGPTLKTAILDIFCQVSSSTTCSFIITMHNFSIKWFFAVYGSVILKQIQCRYVPVDIYLNTCIMEFYCITICFVN